MPSGAVCVIGRQDFETGIGRVTAAALEMFGRFGDVVLLPTRPTPGLDHVVLSNGRRVAVISDPAEYSYFVFTDVLWNGATDFNYVKVPAHGTRIAHVAYDSDELPREWVDILNKHFDAVFFSSEYLESVATSSGVRISVGTLPIALDIEQLIARRPSQAAASKIRIGAISAFHQRKNLDLLVGAFLDAFSVDDPVELVVHSNLAIGDALARVRLMADDSDGRVIVSSGNLSEFDKNELIDSFDVYASASAGEGYAIGPREALALGKRLVLSGIQAHRDLEGVPGVTIVPVVGRMPAHYPEIDGRVIGTQAVVPRDRFARALRAACDDIQADDHTVVHQRKMRAADFSSAILHADYRRLVDPDAPVQPGRWGSPFTRIPDHFLEQRRVIAQRGGRGAGRRRIVIPAHDGGFFSLFNTFASHLTWSLQESSPPMVLPDWDSGRLIQRANGTPIRSYCYSRPTDGNLWTMLFQPLYDLDVSDMNDAEMLTVDAKAPHSLHNDQREPLLTYVHAYELYRSAWFGRFRRQYSDAVRSHIRLVEPLQNELDVALAKVRGRFTVAVHVKHPSHALEQPGQTIAGTPEYFAEVRRALARRGISEASDDWSVFVATDQDRVTAAFEDEFGDHVVRFDDVSRVPVAKDAEYLAMPESERLKEGFQLQHIMASDVGSWSSRLAWEVWRDAEAMAASDVVIHSVSNVATAVSYLGPDAEMVYCDPV